MNLPKLSIIIPSFNQGAYIEETILSIINQDYSNKELIIIDGGSTDNSVNLIKKYEQHITYWISEKDEGQAHAINKGFERATGDYIAWMNSDDAYCENAFSKIFSLSDIDQYDFIFGPVYVGEESSKSIIIKNSRKKKLSVFKLLHFFYLPDYIIPSQSVFVKKEFLEKKNIGLLNTDCHYCMDMEWYCRIAMASPKILRYNSALSFFRINNSTKTGSQYSKMRTEAIQIFLNYKKYLTSREEKKILKLLAYHRILNKLFNNKIKRYSGSLLEVVIRFPAEALSDRRFLGLIKRQLGFNKPNT